MTFTQFLSQFPVGSRNDFDGQFGYQCVDYANFYAKNVLGFTPGMSGINYAKDIWFRDQSFVRGAKSYQKIANSPENFPSPGDLVIWNGGEMGPAGHVAIVLDASPKDMLVREQNGYTQRGVEDKFYKSYHNVLGWLHFENSQDFGQISEPQVVNTQDFVTAQGGWGVSNLAKTANLPDWQSESSWQQVANWNEYPRWEDLQEEFRSGRAIGKSFRIRPRAVMQEIKREPETPAPATVIDFDKGNKPPTRDEVNQVLEEKDKKIEQILEKSEAVEQKANFLQEKLLAEMENLRAEKLAKEEETKKAKNSQEIKKIFEEIDQKNSNLGNKSDVWAKAIQQFIKHNLATGGILATVLTSLNQFDGLGGQIADFILGSQGFWVLTVFCVAVNIFLEYRAEKKKLNQNQLS